MVSRKQGLKVGLTKAMVIQTAADLADREGLDQLSLVRIARTLGVHTPSVSHHVESLSLLRQELAVQATEGLVAAVREALLDAGDQDTILVIYRAYRHFAKDHPGLYESSVRAPNPDDPRRLAALEDLNIALNAALDAYGVHREDWHQAARTLRAAVHGFVSLENTRNRYSPQENDQAFDSMLFVISEGLKSFSTDRKRVRASAQPTAS